jgi:SepF-like predicted cell division protein (DUF552 family)
MSSEERISSLEDDLSELFEDVEAMRHEIMALNVLVAGIADLVKPGLSEALNERIRFIAQANMEINRLKEGDA